MFDIHRVALDWGGRQLVLETGKIARQADGAVLAKYGDTTVLATVVSAKEPKEGIDFLPVVDAIIRLAEKAAMEPREFEVAADEALEKEMLGLVEQDVRAAYAIA